MRIVASPFFRRIVRSHYILVSEFSSRNIIVVVVDRPIISKRRIALLIAEIFNFRRLDVGRNIGKINEDNKPEVIPLPLFGRRGTEYATRNHLGLLEQSRLFSPFLPPG